MFGKVSGASVELITYQQQRADGTDVAAVLGMKDREMNQWDQSLLFVKLVVFIVSV